MGDGGYSAPIVCPRNVSCGEKGTHNFLRGVVENVFAVVDTWGAARERYRGSVGSQVLALICIYELVARQLESSPLRPELPEYIDAPEPILTSEEQRAMEEKGTLDEE